MTAKLAESDKDGVPHSRLTVSEYLTGHWLPSVSKVSKDGGPLAPTTHRRYADAIAHINSVIGNVKLSDLRADDVERLKDRLLDSGKLSRGSVGDVLRVLSQALRRAVVQGKLNRNPADPDVVSRPTGKPAPFTIITSEMAEVILQAARGTDLWDAAANLALGLTLRREEVLALRWRDVELSAGMLSVRATLTYADGKLHEGGPKSEAGERTVRMPRQVLEALLRHRKAQAERRMLIGPEWRGAERHEDDLVVDDGLGGPWLPASFSKGWSRFADKAGFPEVTFHGLRHGAATLMLAAGVSDAVAIKIMGHADTRILRRYQDVVPALLQDAAERMGAVLGKAAY